MKKSVNIGRAEMEVLNYIGEHHPISVGEVAEHFARTKGQVRTTLLNVMERLRDKGLLVRRKINGVFHYSPRIAKAEFVRTLIRNFIETSLGGSVSPFVAYLSEEARLSQAELAELKQLVRELEPEKKERKM